MAQQLDIGTLIVDVIADTRVLERNFNKAEKRVLAFAQRVDRASKRLKSAGTKMSLAITAPMAIFSGYAVKSLADFNDALTESTAIMDVTSKKLRTTMRKSSEEMAEKYAFAADNVAKAYYYLASAGLDTESALKSLTPMMKFARAGAFDLAQATELATDAQSAMGLKVDDAVQNRENLKRTTDKLIKATTLADATTEQFSQSLTNQAGAVARTFNMSMEETLSVLAAMADQGQKGRRAGTRFAITLDQITRAAVENGKAFEKYGVEVYDEATGALRPYWKIIKDLEEAFDALSSKQRDVALKQMGFQVKSMRVIKMLIGYSGAIREWQRELEKAGGYAEKVSSKQMQSLSKQFYQSWQAVNNFLRGMAREFEPQIRKAIDSVEEFANWLDSLPSEKKVEIVTTLGKAAAIGPALFALGALGNVLAWTSRGLLRFGQAAVTARKAAGKTGTAVKFMGRKLDTLGMTLAVVADDTAKATTRLAHMDAKAISTSKAVDKLKKSYDALRASAIGVTIANLGVAFSSATSYLTMFVMGLASVAGYAVIVAGSLTAIYFGVREVIQEFGGLRKMVGEVIGALREFTPKILLKGIDLITEKFDRLISFLGTVVGSIGLKMENIKDAFALFAKSPKYALELAHRTIEFQLEKIQTYWSEWFYHLGKFVSDSWQKFGIKGASYILQAGKWWLHALKAIGSHIGDYFSGLWEFWTNPDQYLKPKIDEKGLVDKWKNAMENAGKEMNDVAEKEKELLKEKGLLDIGFDIKDVEKGALDAMKDVREEYKKDRDKLMKLMEGTNEMTSASFERLMTLIGVNYRNLDEVLNDKAMNNLQRRIEKIRDSSKSNFKKAVDIKNEVKEAVHETVQKGYEDPLKKLLNKFGFNVEKTMKNLSDKQARNLLWRLKGAFIAAQEEGKNLSDVVKSDIIKYLKDIEGINPIEQMKESAKRGKGLDFLPDFHKKLEKAGVNADKMFKGLTKTQLRRFKQMMENADKIAKKTKYTEAELQEVIVKKYKKAADVQKKMNQDTRDAAKDFEMAIYSAGRYWEEAMKAGLKTEEEKVPGKGGGKEDNGKKTADNTGKIASILRKELRSLNKTMNGILISEIAGVFQEGG